MPRHQRKRPLLKKFISRGNVVDMAVGVIIGGAFGKIISSLVNDVIMPVIGLLIGGIDFTNLSVKIGEAVIAYGKFIQTVVDFLIVAICIFAVVRLFKRFKKKEEKSDAAGRGIEHRHMAAQQKRKEPSLEDRAALFPRT